MTRPLGDDEPARGASIEPPRVPWFRAEEQPPPKPQLHIATGWIHEVRVWQILTPDGACVSQYVGRRAVCRFEDL